MPDSFVDQTSGSPGIEGGAQTSPDSGIITPVPTPLTDAPWLTVSVNVSGIRRGGK